MTIPSQPATPPPPKPNATPDQRGEPTRAEMESETVMASYTNALFTPTPSPSKPAAVLAESGYHLVRKGSFIYPVKDQK